MKREPLELLADGRTFTLDDVDVGPPRRWALDNELLEDELRVISKLEVGQTLNLGGGAGATMLLRRAS